jgi:hypothetical protein
VSGDVVHNGVCATSDVKDDNDPADKKWLLSLYETTKTRKQGYTLSAHCPFNHHHHSSFIHYQQAASLRLSSHITIFFFSSLDQQNVYFFTHKTSAVILVYRAHTTVWTRMENFPSCG